MSTIIHAVLMAAFLLGLVATWPTGAPKASCNSAMPTHKKEKNSNDTFARQSGPSPFNIWLTSARPTEQRNGTDGEPLINVTLASIERVRTFKGFLVQALRYADNSSSAPVLIGTFQVTSNNAQLLDCAGRMKNVVTHTNNNSKISESFLWIPDANFTGEVVFRATVVENYTTFWTGLKSLPIDADADDDDDDEERELVEREHPEEESVFPW